MRWRQNPLAGRFLPEEEKKSTPKFCVPGVLGCSLAQTAVLTDRFQHNQPLAKGLEHLFCGDSPAARRQSSLSWPGTPLGLLGRGVVQIVAEVELVGTGTYLRTSERISRSCPPPPPPPPFRRRRQVLDADRFAREDYQARVCLSSSSAKRGGGCENRSCPEELLTCHYPEFPLGTIKILCCTTGQLTFTSPPS